MSDYWDKLNNWQKAKLIFTLLVCIFIFVFAFVNWQRITVNFIFFNLNISMTLLIAISLCLGYLVSSVFESRHYNQKVAEIKELNAENARLKEQIAQFPAVVEKPVILEKEEDSKENDTKEES